MSWLLAVVRLCRHADYGHWALVTALCVICLAKGAPRDPEVTTQSQLEYTSNQFVAARSLFEKTWKELGSCKQKLRDERARCRRVEEIMAGLRKEAGATSKRAERAERDSTRLQRDLTHLQEGSTRLQEESTRLQEGSTRLQEESTRLQRNSTRLRSRVLTLEAASTFKYMLLGRFCTDCLSGNSFSW